MSDSRSLQRMVGRVGGRLGISMAVLALATGCGGERQADTAADTSSVSTASVDTAAVSPTDTVTAVVPDTGSRNAGARDSTTKTPEPASSVTRSSGGRSGTGADTAKAQAARTPRPAATPKPAPTPKPAATPKPTPTPRPAEQQAAAPSPATDTTHTSQDTAQAATAQAPATPAPAAGAPLRDQYHQAPRDTVVQAVYDGWKQYNLNCARCHGEDVLGTTIAPHLVVSLKPDGPINTKESFVQVVCAGRPEKGMPAWCALGLEMDKIDQIYSYVKGRSAGEIGPGRPAVKQGG